MENFDYDDKDLVIIATLILGIIAMLTLSDADAKDIVMPIIAGMFGIAVGKSIT